MCMCVNLSFFALSQIKAYTEFRMPLQPQTSAFGHTHAHTHVRKLLPYALAVPERDNSGSSRVSQNK
jgi:hypothetical protein